MKELLESFIKMDVYSVTFLQSSQKKNLVDGTIKFIFVVDLYNEGVEVHLFEVDDPGKYTYSGVVELAGEPYQETQPDDNGNPRQVWMFPIKKVSEVKVVPEEKPQAESIPEVQIEEVPEKHFDESAVTEQSTVRHNKFGTGIVRKIGDGKIYVEFAGGQRIFQFPDAFDKGYLTL